MGILDDRGEGRLVHAVEVEVAAIAPAIGEHLDDVGVVGQRLRHGDMRGARRGDLQGEEIAPAEFGAMPARHAEPDRELEVRRGDAARRGHLADGCEHLARHRIVVHRGDAVEQITRPAFAHVFRRVIGRRAQMGVQVVQPGRERQAARVDDAGTTGAKVSADRGDTVAAHQHILDDRRRAGPIEHARAADQDRAFGRGAGAGADASEQHRRRDGRTQHLHGSDCFFISVRSRKASAAR